MSSAATWASLIILIAAVCVAGGAWWMSFHLDEEDDADRVLHLDEVRAKRDRALAKSRTYEIGRVR